MFEINLEAMQAVLQSKLGRELDALWQKVIDYRDTSLRDVSYMGKLKALKMFVLKNTFPELKEIIWKNVGLHVAEVTITELIGDSFCSITYFDKSCNFDQKGTFHIENIINANYILKAMPSLQKKLSEKVFTAEELINIAQSFDAETGGIKETAKLELRKMIYSVIGFDVETALLAPERLPANSGVEYFTAREITAVILHEIGHTLTLVEHAGDFYARAATMDYVSKCFEQANSENINEVTALAKMVATKIADSGDKENAIRLATVADKMSADYASVSATVDKNLARRAIGGLLSSTFCFVKDLFVNNLQAKRFGGTTEQKTKFSDLPINRRLVTWEERKADEYAVTHGYGAESVSVNVKLSKYLDRLGMTEKQCAILNDAERLRQDIGFFAKMKLFLRIPKIASDYSYSLYPEGVKRLREILNLTIQKLKANSNDPAYVTKYMQDCEAIINICNNTSQRDEAVAKMYKGYDIFLKYVSIPSFIDWFVHGRVNRELENLIDDANAIGNNLLTYYGFKLQQLANK